MVTVAEVTETEVAGSSILLDNQRTDIYTQFMVTVAEVTALWTQLD